MDSAFSESRVENWLAALERRALADLTSSELARALRALSSCYVERRSKLAEGGALASAGKRAAFALFYAPVHFAITRHVVRALALDTAVTEIVDLGCGTGSAGAAWAIAAGAPVSGIDKHPWAVSEANWTYRQLGIDGRAVRADMARTRLHMRLGTGVLAAYSVNELSTDARAELLPRLLEVRARGGHVLIVEPIARRLTPWWGTWEAAFSAAGGSPQEWRIQMTLPTRQRDLAKAAGLDVRELTARTLCLRGAR